MSKLGFSSDPFPTFLVPALPFRRRKSSTDSAAFSARSDSISSQDAHEEGYLSGHASHLRCSRCLSDLASASQIISKGFTGRHGRAFLVAPSTSANSESLVIAQTPKAKNDALPNLPNTFTHRPVPRQLVTGAHTVSDISCAQCGSNLGWKYVSAEEESQKYKVGKFILETVKVCRSSSWECGMEGGVVERRGSLPPNSLAGVAEEIEFDSQDEDECEDLFMGVWNPSLASRRRKMKGRAKVQAERYS